MENVHQDSTGWRDILAISPVIYREISPEHSRDFYLLSHRHALLHLLQRATGLLQKVFLSLANAIARP